MFPNYFSMFLPENRILGCPIFASKVELTSLGSFPLFPSLQLRSQVYQRCKRQRKFEEENHCIESLPVSTNQGRRWRQRAIRAPIACHFHCLPLGHQYDGEDRKENLVSPLIGHPRGWAILATGHTILDIHCSLLSARLWGADSSKSCLTFATPFLVASDLISFYRLLSGASSKGDDETPKVLISYTPGSPNYWKTSLPLPCQWLITLYGWIAPIWANSDLVLLGKGHEEMSPWATWSFWSIFSFIYFLKDPNVSKETGNTLMDEISHRWRQGSAFGKECFTFQH